MFLSPLLPKLVKWRHYFLLHPRNQSSHHKKSLSDWWGSATENQWLVTNFSGDHLSLMCGYSFMCISSQYLSYSWSPQVAQCECTLTLWNHLFMKSFASEQSNMVEVLTRNVIRTDKSPYVLCNIFSLICWEKYRQFQLHLAARRNGVTHFNLIIILRVQTLHSKTFKKIFFLV